jgi:dTDP-4-dehydrorhamnose 3,5-epimerase
MQVTTAAIPDVLIVEPRVLGEARGFFFESSGANGFFHLRSCVVSRALMR